MNVLRIHTLCRRVLHDPDFRDRVRADPEAALRDMDFDADERRALLAGDVARLARAGAYPFLLLILCRFEIFGLELAVFNRRIRTAAIRETGALAGRREPQGPIDEPGHRPSGSSGGTDP